MSLLEPSDWKVLEPSKFHSGRSGVERGTRHSDQGSLVTRVGSPPPSSITEMKMLVWDRPTIGLIPAQLVLFQMGEVKKNKTPKQAKNRRVHVPNHPGKHKELGCWPSPSKQSSTKDVFYVATTQGDEQSTQSPRRGAWASWERAELQAVGMRGTTKYPYPCCTAWRRWASKYHMWSLIWRRSTGSLVPLPTPPGSALPSGSKHSSELHPGMLSPPYPGGKVGGWEAQRFKGSCANHSLRGKGGKKKKR